MDERDSLHFIRFAHSSRNDSIAIINIYHNDSIAVNSRKRSFQFMRQRRNSRRHRRQFTAVSRPTVTSPSPVIPTKRSAWSVSHLRAIRVSSLLSNSRVIVRTHPQYPHRFDGAGSRTSPPFQDTPKNDKLLYPQGLSSYVLSLRLSG